MIPTTMNVKTYNNISWDPQQWTHWHKNTLHHESHKKREKRLSHNNIKEKQPKNQHKRTRRKKKERAITTWTKMGNMIGVMIEC